MHASMSPQLRNTEEGIDIPYSLQSNCGVPYDFSEYRNFNAGDDMDLQLQGRVAMVTGELLHVTGGRYSS
ncbi:MAG: hypothetical protein QM674_18765 [Burkholderiaceae bacterium]